MTTHAAAITTPDTKMRAHDDKMRAHDENIEPNDASVRPNDENIDPNDVRKSPLPAVTSYVLDNIYRPFSEIQPKSSGWSLFSSTIVSACLKVLSAVCIDCRILIVRPSNNSSTVRIYIRGNLPKCSEVKTG